jgi:rhodanese-related sulfurtransferase
MDNICKMVIAPLTLLIAILGCTVVNNNPVTLVPPTVTENTTNDSLNRVPRITADELWQKLRNNSGVIVIDSRSGVEKLFDEGHIPGAIAVPLDNIVNGAWVPPANKDTEIVFYCSCPDEHTAASAASILITRGYGNVKALKGGYDTWTNANYPIESASNHGK